MVLTVSVVVIIYVVICLYSLKIDIQTIKGKTLSFSSARYSLQAAA